VSKVRKGKAAGPEFDKKFATDMLKDHQKAISKFEKAASKLQEADVKQYAETMLPKLREHLQKAETVARQVGVDQSTISSYTKTSGGLGGTSDTQESTTGTGSTTGQGLSASKDQELRTCSRQLLRARSKSERTSRGSLRLVKKRTVIDNSCVVGKFKGSDHIVEGTWGVPR
jgi:uncharacterized protein (DUF305 family)